MDAATFILEHSNFPPNSRLWVYQADRLLTENEVNALQSDIDAFTAQWQAHGAALKATGNVVNELFIVLLVDENQEPASGCSIDSSVHFIKSLKEKYQLDFLNRNKVAYLDSNQNTALADKTETNQLENNLVFNTSVNSFSAFQKNFIIPFKESAFAKLDTANSFTLKL